MGIENLKKIILLAAEAVNVGSKVLSGGGLLSLLSLVDEVNGLGSLNKDALLAEVKDLSAEERKQLEGIFKEKLSLENKSLEAKIEGGLDILEEGIGLALDAVSLVNEGKKLYQKVEALLA